MGVAAAVLGEHRCVGLRFIVCDVKVTSHRMMHLRLPRIEAKKFYSSIMRLLQTAIVHCFRKKTSPKHVPRHSSTDMYQKLLMTGTRFCHSQ